MFYEEVLYGGYWYFRTIPTGQWIPFTVEQYVQKIATMQQEIDRLSRTTGDKS